MNKISNPPPLFPGFFHHWVFIFGLALTAISLPNSLFFMSVGQFVLGGNWIAEGRYRDKLQLFFQNKAAVVFSLIYILILITMLWTEDFSYGLKELRIKVPLFVFTFFIASTIRKPNINVIYIILMLFALSTFVTTLIGVMVFEPGIPGGNRAYSPFISHIRFGFMIVFSMLLLPWLLNIFSTYFKEPEYYPARTGGLILTIFINIWFVVFLFLMQSLTAFVFLGVLMAFLSLYFLYAIRNKIYFLITTSVFIISFTTSVAFLISLQGTLNIEHDIDINELPQYTSRGNRYYHNLSDPKRENGHLVYIFIAHDELRPGWNQLSDLDFDGPDKLGQEIRFTLYRYLASKGLKKDADGLAKLSEADIKAIENGQANYKYVNWPGFVVRLHQTLWEIQRYKSGRNADGHSLAMRFEYWRAAHAAIKEKPLTGWGAGDLLSAMHYGFEKVETTLDEKNWRTPHNQYLLFAIILGIPATILLLSMIVYTFLKSGATRFLPFNVFIILMAVSMFTEDTLQSQAGMTFFMLIFAIFNFAIPAKDNPLPDTRKPLIPFKKE